MLFVLVAGAVVGFLYSVLVVVVVGDSYFLRLLVLVVVGVADGVGVGDRVGVLFL